MMRKILFILVSVALLCSLLITGCQVDEEVAPPPVGEETVLNLYDIY